MALPTENPYDFSNAVTDPDMLAGRGELIREVSYYLDQARAKPQPVNLAILGQRASGKTSVLNVIASMAKQRAFMLVRFDLDSSDVATPLVFFHRLLDEVLTAAISSGAFGGKAGSIATDYNRLSYGSDEPAGPSFPLQFPVQWAIAAKQHALDLPVSTGTVIADLQAIRDAVECPIVLLIDEGDVLSSDASLLQKLRNVLMHLRGYFVVLVGTDELFPNLDRVFSPIARQFKTLTIGPFDDPHDTEECIVGPLRKVGLDPLRVMEFETFKNLTEIHDISRGRPYEIKLLCHFMFRRVQEGVTKKMSLDLGVLEEVRRQLEKERNVAKRPVLTSVRALDAEAMEALAAIVDSDRIATLDEKWQVEYAFFGSSRYSQAALNHWAEDFVATGILVVENNKLVFNGDDFDRLYVTYLARERGIPLSFPPLGDVPIEVYWSVSTQVWLARRGALRVGPVRFGERRRDLDQLALVNMLNAMSGVTDNISILDRNTRLTVDLHNLMAQMQGRDYVPVWIVRLRIGRVDTSSLNTGPGVTSDDDRATLEADLNFVRVRIGEMGGTLEIEEFQLPVYDLQAISRTLARSGSEDLKRALCRVHGGMARSFYNGAADCSEALTHANLAFVYGADVWPSMANDLGYVFLAGGDIAKSVAVLNRAIQATDGDVITHSLASYNLAMAVAHRGEFAEALGLLDKALLAAQELDEQDRQMMCLIVGSTSQGRLHFDEVQRPDLLVAIRNSIVAIAKAQESVNGKSAG